MKLPNLLCAATTLSLLWTSHPASASILQTATYNGHTYYLLSASRWEASEVEAITLGGHLVTINDAAENDFVLNTFKTTAVDAAPPSSNVSLLIGLNDVQTEGTFVWASSEPVTYTNWEPGQPQGFFADEDYGAMLVNFTPTGGSIGQWHDVVSDDRFGDVQFGVVEVDSLAPTTKLLNISTRMQVLTDDNVLIGGFIITGTAPKNVIVRAIGPSLAGSGVSGALADPTLDLNLPDGSVITNDNWKDTQKAEIEATTIPPTNDKESAIVQSLVPGAYTAIVRGKNSPTGVGLVEAYDLDQPADSRLANISTRGFIDTGDNVMIGGFIIGPFDLGNATVLIRGIGPSLANSGVADPLQDPTLELHDGNGALLMSNDDWKDDQQSEIEATTIPPTDDRESAILQTLVPGNYTAIVRGAAGTTGVGLVEVFHLQ